MFPDDDPSVVFRGSSVALESSGMPTVPNNLRSQTPDRSSTCSDNRRVRVSNRHQKNPKIHNRNATGGSTLRRKFSIKSLSICVCVCVLSRSLTERRASPAFRPATPLLRKELRATTHRIQAPRPFLCPGPQFHQVSAFAFNFSICFLFSTLAW